MKKRMLGSKVIAKYGEVCPEWTLKKQAAMETVGIAPLASFSKYCDLKEDAWESALAAVIPGKFIELNKTAFNFRKNA